MRWVAEKKKKAGRYGGEEEKKKKKSTFMALICTKRRSMKGVPNVMQGRMIPYLTVLYVHTTRFM